jgi:hypothetical protein
MIGLIEDKPEARPPGDAAAFYREMIISEVLFIGNVDFGRNGSMNLKL